MSVRGRPQRTRSSSLRERPTRDRECGQRRASHAVREDGLGQGRSRRAHGWSRGPLRLAGWGPGGRRFKSCLPHLEGSPANRPSASALTSRQGERRGTNPAMRPGPLDSEVACPGDSHRGRGGLDSRYADHDSAALWLYRVKHGGWGTREGTCPLGISKDGTSVCTSSRARSSVHITKTGNRHARRLLIEAAWHCRHRPHRPKAGPEPSDAPEPRARSRGAPRLSPTARRTCWPSSHRRASPRSCWHRC